MIRDRAVLKGTTGMSLRSNCHEVSINVRVNGRQFRSVETCPWIHDTGSFLHYDCQCHSGWYIPALRLGIRILGSVYRKHLTTKYISTSTNPARNIPAGMDKSAVRIQRDTVIAVVP